MLFNPTSGTTADSEEAHQQAYKEALARDPRLAARLQEIDKRGYCVIEGALNVDQLQRTKGELAPWLQQKLMGRNDFEGTNSERVYALLAKAPVIAEMVEHPDVLAIANALLSPGYLLSAALAINVHPGETPQPWHIDDGAGGDCVPKPRRPLGVSAIWAIDDFTKTNGATEVAPGSHQWEEGRYPEHGEFESVLMPKGSALVFAGSLIHRGGANTSDSTRLAITPQYCMPWLRQIENMVLAVPPEVARQYSQRVQELLGYSVINPGFMGYVDGRNPRSMVDPDFVGRKQLEKPGQA